MPKVEYKILAKYPHLRPEDVRIWEKFIRKYPNFFGNVSYDVKVGKGRDYSMYPESKIREDMEYLSKKRIDVVGYSNGSIYVIELKPRASMSAVGQALSLAELMRDEVGPEKRVVPVIITDEEVPDIKDLCSRMGVLYFLV